jgi:hypothetical protein
LSVGAGAQTPPHTPTITEFRARLTRLRFAERDIPPVAAITTTTWSGPTALTRRAIPPVTDAELANSATFIGSDRLAHAYLVAKDDETRRRLFWRVRFEHARWTRAMPITWQQERRIADYWRGSHLTTSTTAPGLRRPGRPTSNMTAQADALRARIEQEAGSSWDALSEAQRRDLVIRLATKGETSAAASLLDVHRGTINRLRKAASA